MRVATLAVGYGDGYLRAYASAGVTIAGQKCTTLGRICMDYMMVDVTHIKTPLKLGDEAILIHSDPKIGPTAEDLAKTAKTISYEILTTISQRVLRTWTA